jgi:hypothetical protein
MKKSGGSITATLATARIHTLVSCLAICALLALPTGGYAAVVAESEAVAAADLWLRMELAAPWAKLTAAEAEARLSQLKDPTVWYLAADGRLLDTPRGDHKVLAYVVEYPDGGLAVVSAEDRLEPVIVFGLDSKFRWDCPERNFLRHFLTTSLPVRWKRLEDQLANGIEPDVHSKWTYLRSKLLERESEASGTFPGAERAIYVLWDTPLWAQGWPYNTEVVHQNGDIPDIPTGCTATAMAIKMRFHRWPPFGDSWHSYTDSWGSVQYSHVAHFNMHTYDWANMPTGNVTTHNSDVANLMYDCGVAVDMDYEVGASGAWPSAFAMNTYFRYKGTVELTSDHELPMIASIRGGLPVIICHNTHTVVVAGYRDAPSPYFYMNAGWDGSGNDWYNLDDIPGTDPTPTIERSYPWSTPSNYIYVSSTWEGDEDGGLPTPFNTLVEGETAVPEGGHLWLKVGTYTRGEDFPILVDKEMTIMSYEGPATIGPS